MLIASHFVANTAIGISLWFWANLSAESVLSRWLPPWFWPVMFLAAGMFALLGFKFRIFAQFSFLFAASLTFVFGVLSFYAVLGGMLAATTSMIFLFYITILKIMLARLILQRERILQEVVESTERGQAVLSRTTDGAAS